MYTISCIDQIIICLCNCFFLNQSTYYSSRRPNAQTLTVKKALIQQVVVALFAGFNSSVTEVVCCLVSADLLGGQSWFELLKQGAGIWASRSTCICNRWQFHLCWPKVKKSSKVEAAFTFSHPYTSCCVLLNTPDESSTPCLRYRGTILKDARRNLIKVPVTLSERDVRAVGCRWLCMLFVPVMSTWRKSWGNQHTSFHVVAFHFPSMRNCCVSDICLSVKPCILA